MPDPRRFRAAIIAWLVAVGLAALLYRHGPMLTFDGYHYCEFAKTYTTSWPQAFGNHWPCGYPLLGGMLGRLGLPAYQALCLVSLLALAMLGLLGNCFTKDLPHGALALSALAATPVIGVQLLGNLTELPFAAALLGLATALAVGRAPIAWWSAAACALLALSLRYAGVIAYPMLWIWLALHVRPLRQDGFLGSAVVALACSTVTAAGLLLWNFRATGHLSGASFASAEDLGLAVWPSQVAAFGWAPFSALMLGGLRDHVGGHSLLGQLIGSLSSLALGALCLWGWAKPRFPWVRVLAFVSFAYGAGMTVLRSTTSFDSLYNGRMFLPALIPLGLVAIAQFSGRWPRLVAGACTVLLAIGIASSTRGLSREIAGNVRDAVPLLRDRLRTTDSVQINDQAFSLAAYLPQRTFRTSPESWRPDEAQRFLVIAAEPVGRRGTPGTLPTAWKTFAEQLVAGGTHRWLLETPSLLVLEHPAGTVPR
jgi:hypothetical protein